MVALLVDDEPSPHGENAKLWTTSTNVLAAISSAQLYQICRMNIRSDLPQLPREGRIMQAQDRNFWGSFFYAFVRSARADASRRRGTLQVYKNSYRMQVKRNCG